MKPMRNIVQLQAARELDANYGRLIQDRFHASSEFVHRLGLYTELDSHNGCVNCLEWSEDGTLLASGSDDVHISIWDPYRKKNLAYFGTGHHGNIFTVKFLPNSDNRTVISGAADNGVRVHDIAVQETLRVCTCHTNRVKRAVVDPNIPYLYWSAGEDGMIIQHDMRENHSCSTESKRPKNVMVDLRNYLGSKAEAKCLAIDPVRSEYFAVGANDPYVRIYDRRLIKLSNEEARSDVPFGAAQYFVPGHLPPKIGEYKRKYRSLASTYVSYSPDGRELLVNLGGEQIYLFPTVGELPKGVTSLTIPKGLWNENEGSSSFKNGSTRADGSGDPGSGKKLWVKVPLPPSVEYIKTKANEAFGTKNYPKAIHYYNEALKLAPNSAILHANRAAALVKRGWDGDLYAALKDCQEALSMDPDYYKAHMRMCRCLFELKRFKESQECLDKYKLRFPDSARDAASSLQNDLTKAKLEQVSTKVKEGTRKRSTNPLVRFRLSSARRNSNDDATAASANQEDNEENESDTNSGPESVDDCIPVIDSSEAEESSRRSKNPFLYEEEISYKKDAVDYNKRFCGHCNTTTDIKEANFFGNFIVAGSDDGSFFIWDRENTNIVKIIKGDESIVNCLQPHPTSCCLATSGIESVIRIWTPMPEGQENERIVKDVQDAASANQRRMNSNPFEVILMNMGYRVTGDGEGSEEEANDDSVPMHCNPT